MKLITLIGFSLKCSTSLSGLSDLDPKTIQTNSTWCRLCCTAHRSKNFLTKERGIPIRAEAKVWYVPIEVWADVHWDLQSQKTTGAARYNERTPVENRAMRIWHKSLLRVTTASRNALQRCFVGHCIRLWGQHWLTLHWALWLQPTSHIWGKCHLWGHNKGIAFKTRNLTAVELIAGIAQTA